MARKRLGRREREAAKALISDRDRKVKANMRNLDELKAEAASFRTMKKTIAYSPELAGAKCYYSGRDVWNLKGSIAKPTAKPRWKG